MELRTSDPLLISVRKGNTCAVKYLLEIGKINPNLIDNYGPHHRDDKSGLVCSCTTPLSLAVFYMEVKVVELLLGIEEVIPDLTCRCNQPRSGRTALSYATGGSCYTYGVFKKRGLSVVELLLQTGKVDPDSIDSEGRTPLYHAMNMMHPEFESSGARPLPLNVVGAMVLRLLRTRKIDLERGCYNSKAYLQKFPNRKIIPNILFLAKAVLKDSERDEVKELLASQVPDRANLTALSQDLVATDTVV